MVVNLLTSVGGEADLITVIEEELGLKLRQTLNSTSPQIRRAIVI